MTFHQWLKVWKSLDSTKTRHLTVGIKMLKVDYSDGMTPQESLHSWVTCRGPNFASCGIPDSAIKNWGKLLDEVVSFDEGDK